MKLFLAFLIVPLIEIALFIQVGGFIGLWPTLGIVVVTAALGTWLVKNQGTLAMGQLRTSFSKLDDPTEPLAHGAMILVAGALLLTPGFFTDGVGFALLMPPVRTAVFGYLRKRMTVHQFHMGSGNSQTQSGSGGQFASDESIETDYHEINEPKQPNRSKSDWTKH